MVRPNQRDRDEILDGLDASVAAYRQSKCRVTNDVLLVSVRYICFDLDRARSSTIDMGELHKLLRRIILHMSRKRLDESYKKFANVLALKRPPGGGHWRSTSASRSSTRSSATRGSASPCRPCGPTDQPSPRFPKNFSTRDTGRARRHPVTPSYVRHHFREPNQLEIAKVSNTDHGPTKYIGKHRFKVYLSSEANDTYKPPRQKFQRDAMSMPFSHYWINSSHNMYLTGDQIKSQSSVEMNMAALYGGCRCVEIDVWEGKTDLANDGGGGGGGTKPIPVVYHGHTMTSKIPFAETIGAIKVILNFHPKSLTP